MRSLSLFVLGCLFGCGVDPALVPQRDIGTRQQAERTHQERTHQGNTFGGESTGPIAVDPESFIVKEILESVTASQTNLSGFTLRGLRLSGADLVGATFSGVDPVRGAVLFRIDGHAVDNGFSSLMELPAHRQNNQDIHLFKVMYERGGAYKPLCPRAVDRLGVELVHSEKAVLVDWDFSRTVTLSFYQFSHNYQPLPGRIRMYCWDGVAVKCMRWGYHPWRSLVPPNGTAPVSLEGYYAACVRGAMADYCGYGQSRTLPNTEIDIWDRAGFIAKTPETTPGRGFTTEASFSPIGARCLDHARFLELPPDCTRFSACAEPLAPPEPGPGQPHQCPVTQLYRTGDIASCSEPEQIVFVANAAHCPHNVSVIGGALARDCNTCTAQLCAQPGFAYCCDPSSGNGLQWDLACATEATRAGGPCSG
jgi:hypothetical protein